MITYQMLADSFTQDPRDIHTVPLSGTPIWFYTYTENGVIYVEPARKYTPSSKIAGRRALNEEETNIMYALYKRRTAGEAVSQEAQQATINQVYWYGVFSDLKL